MRKHWIFLAPYLLSALAYTDTGDQQQVDTEYQQQQTQLVPPEQIQEELNKANRDFDAAKKMFNPWYTGPLLTPSSAVLPPPHVVIQPYCFFTNNYAAFDKHGKSHKLPHDKFQIKPSISPIQVGITKWMDSTLSFGAVGNYQNHHSYWDVSDTSLGVGFGLLKQTPYRPGIKFVVGESFPTGNYQKFKAHRAGVSSTGSGSFMTSFSLNISKVVWWLTRHPMNLRSSIQYTVNSNVDVKGFNTYGGGKGTDGTVKGGNTFAFDFGYEYSFTQRWVAAIDVVYNYSQKNTFSGDTVAPVGGPFNDQLSFAPAIEYNPSENGGMIAGVWFTAWGRNASNFVSGVLSFYYMF